MTDETRRLRILFCGLNHPPETMGCARFTARIIHSLRDAGHEVRAIVAPPHFPEHRVWSGYNPRSWHGNFDRGDTVHCPTLLRSTKGFIRRAVACAVFGATCQRPLRRAGAWKPHLVWTVAPTLACAPAVLEAARRYGAVSWLHVQDYESGALESLSRCPEWLCRRAEGLEQRFMARFDLTSSISPHMVARLHGLDELREPKGRQQHESPYLLPNPADTACLAPLDALRREGDRMRALLGITPRTRVVLLAGTMGKKQDSDLLPEVGACLSRLSHQFRQSSPDRPGRQDVLLLAAGRGAGFEALRRRTQDSPGLRLVPSVPEQNLPALLAMADLHLVMLRPGADDFCHPSRLANILAVGGSMAICSRSMGPLHEWAVEHPRSCLHVPCNDTAARPRNLARALLLGLETLPQRNPHSRQSALNQANPRLIYPALEQWLLRAVQKRENV